MRVGGRQIEKRRQLRAMSHVILYGPHDLTARGGTIAFNVHGVPYAKVERRVREAGISIRGGCFCNPGAAECAFGIVAEAHLKGMVGALRASVGLANNRADIERVIDLIATFGVRSSRA